MARSVLDMFYDRAIAANKQQPEERPRPPKREARQHGDPYRGAIELFSRPEDSSGYTRRSFGERQEGESVIEWERRLRDAEKREGQHEPLYADQYPGYNEDDDRIRYHEEAMATEERVQAAESRRDLDMQWSGPGADFSSQDQSHEMRSIEVDESQLRMAMQQGMMSPDDARRIAQKGHIRGLSSSDFSRAPKEENYDRW